MADDVENDDQWLYGENEDENDNENDENGEVSNEIENNEEENADDQAEDVVNDEANEDLEDDNATIEETTKVNGLQKEDEVNEAEEKPDEKEDGDLENGDDELDDSDDDVNVVIGDFTAATVYPQQLNIKRGGISTAIIDKSKQVVQSGKFQVEEFEQIGTINGLPASDYNFESLEEKPWRKPGADITDYFNYGFNEDTWKAYCERQKRIRVNESGVGIVQLNSIGLPRQPVIINENSKYGNQSYGTINTLKPIQNSSKPADIPKVNTIQVMTADRREYSRKSNFPDMSVPPPTSYVEPFHMPDYGFNPEPEPFYGGDYEPTQESQWMDGPVNPIGWQPSDIKTLTGDNSNSSSVPPTTSMAPPPAAMRNDCPSPSMFRRSNSKENDYDREKEKDIRERGESRSHSVKPRDYEREKSRRRDRSRSRSRRHRSRSRSPSHRSHKKKKSRRHEESE